MDKTEEALQRLEKKVMELEQHVINLILPIQDLRNDLKGSDYLVRLKNTIAQPVKLDDTSFRRSIDEFNKLFLEFNRRAESFDKQSFTLDLKNFYDMISLLKESMQRINRDNTSILRWIKKKDKVQLKIFLDEKEMEEKKPKKTASKTKR